MKFGNMKSRMLMLFVVITGLLTGCASPRFLDGQEHALREIALVTDATVVNERVALPAQINSASDNRLAAQLEEVMTEVLGGKGYLPIPMVRTTGLGFSSGQPVEVVIDMSVPHFGPPNVPPYSAFIRAPGINIFQVGALHHHPANSRFMIPGPDGRPLPVLVVSIRGKTSNGVTLPANQARGVNTVILSQGAPGAASWPEYDSNTLSIDVSLIEADTGKLLWEGSKKLAAEPDIRNYAGELRKLLKQFPARKAL